MILNLFLALLVICALIFASIGIYTKCTNWEFNLKNSFKCFGMFIVYFIIFYPLVLWFVIFNTWLLITEFFDKDSK